MGLTLLLRTLGVIPGEAKHLLPGLSFQSRDLTPALENTHRAAPTSHRR